ncbi:TIGR01777 family oxidoreductase [Bdellovibrio bacteriovorus]|uniref:TIGR01777 family oxidoreductase n=1 Tax=Bdellovibrio bacteriovorus TaxID=959 RepID=UPI0035A6B508
MRILMTGATGLIGRELGKVLAEKGHDLYVVSRDQAKAREQLPFPCEIIEGDLNTNPLHDSRLAKVEVVFNLMGESIAGERWSEEKKKRIYQSRVIGTRHLVQSLPENLKCFISSSAMGIYGDQSDAPLTEDSPHGEDFLANVCKEWEAEAAKAPGRSVFVRTGIVLARQGGALDQMLFPFRSGVGGVLGDGKQWMSWIHLNDIVGLYLFALEHHDVEGALNAGAPHPVTNREFSETLVQSLGTRLGPAVPLFALNVLFGELAKSLVASARMVPEKAQRLGYKFHYENLLEALNEICLPFKMGEEIFVAEQFVPAPPEKLFPFFKDAHNLERITPPTLNFLIEKMSTPEIGQGTQIDYRLKIHGVPAKWKTEIDEWQPPFKFVDNQLKGPYRLWHHTHEFRPFCGGTLLVDRVRYRMPMGFLGWLVANRFVRKDVENIFAFRRKYIANMGTLPTKTD